MGKAIAKGAVAAIATVLVVVAATWWLRTAGAGRDDAQTLLVRMNRVTGEVRAELLEDPEDGVATPTGVDENVFLLRVDPETGGVDALDAGVPWYWLAFGFGAQILFTLRMLVQLVASERAQASIVPPAFWVLSLLGGLTLLLYFLRRGDPVGVLGQSVGVFIYVRNLSLIYRRGGGGPQGRQSWRGGRSATSSP